MSQIITRLYVKTHNVTGLKYFGKTIQKDYNKYRGSGVYWEQHIRKHGYDVTTEILGEFTEDDDTWLTFYACEFSEVNDIVNSSDWANLKPENGKDGWNRDRNNNDFSTQEERKQKRHEQNVAAGKKSHAMKAGIHGLSKQQIKDRTDKISKKARDTKSSRFITFNSDPEFIRRKKEGYKISKHQQGEKNSMYGTCWIYHELIGSKQVDKTLLDDFISQGWVKGRKVKRKLK